MASKLLLLIIFISFVSSCSTEEADSLFVEQATRNKDTNTDINMNGDKSGSADSSKDTNTENDDTGRSETISTNGLVTFTCELADLIKRKCLLPNVKGKKPLRIVDVINVVNKGSRECLLDNNMTILGNLLGIRIKKGCEGTFTVRTTRNVKKINYGTKVAWSKMTIKALDFGEAEVEDGLLLSDHHTGIIKADASGLGVSGGRHAGHQINYDVNLGQSQGLLFELPTNTIGINIVLSNLYKGESTGERAELIVLDENYRVIVTKIRSKLARYKDENRNHIGQVRLRGLSRAKFLLVKAAHYKDVEVKENSDSSDFYVRYLNILTAK